MKNKYYTPELEEFHVGFEFEVFVDAVKGWRKFSIKDGKHLDFILNENKVKKVRVKYLDKEDIESLGFNIRYSNEEFWMFEKDNIVLGYKPLLNTLKMFSRDHSEDKLAVNLIIKNKSELKKLLKNNLEI